MAILTSFVAEGFMHVILKKRRVLRGMGSMAVPAIHLLSTDADVSLIKGGFFIIMALPTQLLNGLDE